jgi:hypothetical protein
MDTALSASTTISSLHFRFYFILLIKQILLEFKFVLDKFDNNQLYY